MPTSRGAVADLVAGSRRAHLDPCPLGPPLLLLAKKPDHVLYGPGDPVDSAGDATSTPMDLSWRVERNPPASASPQPTEPSKLQTKKRKMGEAATIYICPICSRELPTLTAFIEHMATHHHKLPDGFNDSEEETPVLTEDRAFVRAPEEKLRDCQKCQQMGRKGVQNGTHRRLSRDLRSRDLEQHTRGQEGGATTLAASTVPPTAADYEDCPRICLACPQRAAFTCMEEALAHFETHHVHSVAICSLCGLWFTSKSLFAAHAMEAHVRRTERSTSPRRSWIASDKLRDAATSLSESNFFDPVVASILLSGLLLSSSSQTLRLLPYIRDGLALTTDTLPRKLITTSVREAAGSVRPVSPPKPVEQRSEENSQCAHPPVGSSMRPPALEVKANSNSSSPPRERIKMQATSPSGAPSSPPREVGTDSQRSASEPSAARTIPLLLFDHPIQRLLPPHVAVAIDRRTVAKMCHICFKASVESLLA
ncbi:hypothetical protein SprV_0501784900 [Sparganum proliferum]